MSHRCPLLTLGQLGPGPLGHQTQCWGQLAWRRELGWPWGTICSGAPPKFQRKEGSSGVKEGCSVELGDREGLRTRSPLAAGLRSGQGEVWGKAHCRASKRRPGAWDTGQEGQHQETVRKPQVDREPRGQGTLWLRGIPGRLSPVQGVRAGVGYHGKPHTCQPCGIPPSVEQGDPTSTHPTLVRLRGAKWVDSWP